MNFAAMPSINAVTIALCRAILCDGILVDPRKMPTRELLGVGFEIVDPRKRLTTIPVRRWSSALAIGELMWNVRADTSVEPLAFYSARWRDFADEEGNIRGSCYGARIFSPVLEGLSQWDMVKKLLVEDKSSRRAVLTFLTMRDVSADTNDLSCTNTLQFIVRDDKLHAFVNMRSNDVIWGVPYDVFLFTSLQEMMAVELGLDLGVYRHYAASMHVYDRHFKLASDIAALDDRYDARGEMPRIESIEEIERMKLVEVELRLGGSVAPSMSPYEHFCIEALSRHHVRQVA